MNWWTVFEYLFINKKYWSIYELFRSNFYQFVHIYSTDYSFNLYSQRSSRNTIADSGFSYLSQPVITVYVLFGPRCFTKITIKKKYHTVATCKPSVYFVGWIGGWALSVLFPRRGLGPLSSTPAANSKKSNKTMMTITFRKQFQQRAL